MKHPNLAKHSKMAILVLFITVCMIPQLLNAQNNGNGSGYGQGNKDDQGNGVPVNNGIYLLALAGAAYAAKKIYDLKKKQAVA